MKATEHSALFNLSNWKFSLEDVHAQRYQSPGRLQHRVGSLGGEGGIDLLLAWVERVANRLQLYYGFHQPAEQTLELPAGPYRIDIIDTWEMTTTPLNGTFGGKFKIQLPGNLILRYAFRKPKAGISLTTSKPSFVSVCP